MVTNLRVGFAQALLAAALAHKTVTSLALEDLEVDSVALGMAVIGSSLEYREVGAANWHVEVVGVVVQAVGDATGSRTGAGIAVTKDYFQIGVHEFSLLAEGYLRLVEHPVARADIDSGV